MLYCYDECLKKYGSHYYLEKALSKGEIFKISNGLYSDKKNVKDIEIYIKKHKGAIFTMESAFYYLGVSDVVSEKYIVATSRDATKYKNDNVVQYFMDEKLLEIGAETIIHNNVSIPTFNKERMLIEVIRYKNKLPFDYYKDVINYYRNHIGEIDLSTVMDYLERFPKKKSIMKAIQMEVL